jgi:hypothetical protein
MINTIPETPTMYVRFLPVIFVFASMLLGQRNVKGI